MRAPLSLLVLLLALPAARADAPPARPAPAVAGPVKPAPPKPVKQETRAELEAEVEQLRAENQKLRGDLAQMHAREDERAKRIHDAIGTPTTTLK
jgi:Skp family chaperone for outer membrane proteins